MNDELETEDRRALTRQSAVISRAEDRLQTARFGLLDLIKGLLKRGYSQAAIARALGVTRATLNQKVLAAGLRKGSKASKRKQGKHR